MQNRQNDSKNTFQVLVDKGWWKLLSLLKADTKQSFKDLVEDALSNTYGIDKNGQPYRINRK